MDADRQQFCFLRRSNFVFETICCPSSKNVGAELFEMATPGIENALTVMKKVTSAMADVGKKILRKHLSAEKTTNRRVSRRSPPEISRRRWTRIDISVDLNWILVQQNFLVFDINTLEGCRFYRFLKKFLLCNQLNPLMLRIFIPVLLLMKAALNLKQKELSILKWEISTIKSKLGYNMEDCLMTSWQNRKSRCGHVFHRWRVTLSNSPQHYITLILCQLWNVSGHKAFFPVYLVLQQEIMKNYFLLVIDTNLIEPIMRIAHLKDTNMRIAHLYRKEELLLKKTSTNVYLRLIFSNLKLLIPKTKVMPKLICKWPDVSAEVLECFLFTRRVVHQKIKYHLTH